MYMKILSKTSSFAGYISKEGGLLLATFAMYKYQNHMNFADLIHSELIIKCNASLRSLFATGHVGASFYGDFGYKFKRIISLSIKK